jgi:fucose permease
MQTRGVKMVLVAFLFYCGVELTLGLWGSSYLVRARGVDAATAAAWVSSFYGSITIGRLATGFITMKVTNKKLIRAGQMIILSGAILLFLPLPSFFALVGFILIGLGCAPIFPGMLHETPVRFGKENAQHVMGFQMAAAYIGSTFLPPIFGFIATQTTLALLPVFVLVYATSMMVSSEQVNAMLSRKVEAAQQPGFASD